MNKVKHTAQVQSIRNYLEGIGKPISQVQAHEVLARALGLKNKHALSALVEEPSTGSLEVPQVPQTLRLDGENIPVRKQTDGPYTVAELRAMDWSVDVVIPMPADVLFGHIELCNDYASNFLTGLDFSLQDIHYDRLPSNRIYGDEFEPVRVTGYISEPEVIFDEEADAQDAEFYAGLSSFFEALRTNPIWEVKDSSALMKGTVLVLDNEMKMLEEYARTCGQTNDEVNEIRDNFVVLLKWDDSPVKGFTVDQLKYAVPRKDSFCVGATVWTAVH